MNFSDLEIELRELVHHNNRPLINILALDFIMKYVSPDDKEFSLLLKTCAFFYKFCIDHRETFAILEQFNGDYKLLPWNVYPDRWIYPGVLDIKNEDARDRRRVLWLKLLDHWFSVYFRNRHFYLRWSAWDGWGWYCRHDIVDIRNILSFEELRYSSFLESIDEVQKEILKSLGFRSFFEYNNPGTPSSDLWIIYGFLWFANSNLFSPIGFDQVNENDPDGLPYRTMIEWNRTVWTEV